MNKPITFKVRDGRLIASARWQKQWPHGRTAMLRTAERKWHTLALYLENPDADVPNDGGATTCACCRIYPASSDTPPCQGCPIAAATGQAGCVGTPYAQYAHARIDYETQTGHKRNNARKRARQAAQDMVELIAGLLNQ